ncbi:MAG: hypothetical protein HQK53_00705 [Oligoflexia bacterium]|nr:hypothetical protein [Oligoflexia bacterium]
MKWYLTKKSGQSFFATAAVLLFLGGCLNSKVGERTIVINTSTPTPVETSTPVSTPTSDQAVYWYGTTNVGKVLGVSANSKSVAYIKGLDVERFLSEGTNNQNPYCVLFTFLVGGIDKKQLRVHSAPMQQANYEQATKEKYLRLDFGEETSSRKACGGVIDGFAADSPDTVYWPGEVCSKCTQNISSIGKGVKLYYSSSTMSNSSEVPTSKLDLSSLTLQLLVNSDAADSNKVCDKSDCRRQGLDCCLDGQCVKDGALRPNAASNPNYRQALTEAALNPMKFVSWPEIYYVCTERVVVTPTASTTPGTEVSAAKLRIQYLKEYYFCSVFAQLDPAIYKYCQSSFDASSYNVVKNIIWSLCECATVGTPAPEDPQNTCTTYGLDAYDSSQNLISFSYDSANPITPSLTYGRILSVNTNKITDVDVSVRGSSVNSYLRQGSNLQNNYCLVINFDKSVSSGAGVLKKQLRLFAEVVSQKNFATKENENFFRFDLTNAQKNQLYCTGDVSDIEGNSVSGSDAAYTISNVCVGNCSSLNQGGTALYISSNVSSTQTISESGRVTSPSLSVLKLNISNTGNTESSSTLAGYYWSVVNADKIADVRCHAQSQAEPTPFQELNKKINARSAPHRFFSSSDGKEILNFSMYRNTPETTPISVEGTPFSYEDELRKTKPKNVKFNMNAILGQMNADGSRALPAVVLNIKSRESYIISVVSGTYSPCPMCAPDPWFSSFSAFPPSSIGVGLQSIGHTTSRSSMDDNHGKGNYEDTIWGRACWIPPTMIPFSHRGADTVVEQRARRLKTQAAFYVNGYKRDWYGFNLGALIGSFDGVSWFAIGNNRRVVATSDKLFLAINAPFADLADPTDLVVQVISDDGGVSTVPTYDWNHDITDSKDPNQNNAGSCQENHFCNNDVDCITSLGWEYMCGKVSLLRTRWPRFSENGDELRDKEEDLNSTAFTADNFFGSVVFDPQNLYPWKNSKRCVYRGMGAPCVVDYSKIDNLDLRRLFTCAPNFYCAGLESQEFNSELNREPSNVFAILFGQEANMLGRPKNYTLLAKDKLDEGTVQTAIQLNAKKQKSSLYDGDKLRVGLCRPGKNLTLSGSGRPVNSHKSKDPAGRADYISQIGSCNADYKASASVGIGRIHSCPLLYDDPDDVNNYGNYYYINSIVYPSSLEAKMKAQNSCGAESLHGMGFDNVFAEIEMGPSTTLKYLDRNGGVLVKDACLRRAGAICHSDLDCSPSKFHEEIAGRYNRSYFGDTEAERNYWKESLICGQYDEKTSYTSTNAEDAKLYKNFQFNRNRCCRASGQTLTMYTQGFSDAEMEEDEILANAKLDTAPSGFAVDYPYAEGRYSRYTILEKLTTDTGSVMTTPLPVQLKVVFTPAEKVYGTPGSKVPAPYQWKTVHDTAAKTCCSGWVRAFADGTHNWLGASGKLSFDINNFACINFRNPIFDDQYKSESISDQTWSQEKAHYCEDRVNWGCIHYMQGKSGMKDSVSYSSDRGGIAKSTKDVPIVFPQPLSNEWASTDWSNRVWSRDSLRSDTKAVMGDPSLYIHSAKRMGYLHDLAPYLIFGVDDAEITGFLNAADANLKDNAKYCYDPDGDTAYRYGAMGPGCPYLVLQIPSYMYGGQNIEEVWLSRRSIGGDDFEGWGEGGSADKAPAPMLLARAAESNANGECRMQGNTNVPRLFEGGDTFADMNNNIKSGWCYRPVSGNRYGWLYIRRPFCHSFIAGVNVQDQAPVDGVDDATQCVLANFNFDLVRQGNYSNTAGVIVKFKSFAHTTFSWGTPGIALATATPKIIIPGNDVYYLEKLARLDLKGIPGMPYEPIYCSYNANMLVPGIFKDVITGPSGGATPFTNRAAFESKAINYDRTDYYPITIPRPGAANQDETAPTPKVVFKDLISEEHADIFSPDQFFCCQRLGSVVTDYTKCCSGFAKLVPAAGAGAGGAGNTERYVCTLPRSTDLNVYFNRFVSGEGSYPELDKTIRLLDSDFDPVTGYPLSSTQASTLEKLVALGEKFCSDLAVVTGAAFGNYGPRPGSGIQYDGNSSLPVQVPYGILYRVEAPADRDYTVTQNVTDGYKGAEWFNVTGRRWNHHYYCGKNTN